MALPNRRVFARKSADEAHPHDDLLAQRDRKRVLLDPLAQQCIRRLNDHMLVLPCDANKRGRVARQVQGWVQTIWMGGLRDERIGAGDVCAVVGVAKVVDGGLFRRVQEDHPSDVLHV